MNFVTSSSSGLFSEPPLSPAPVGSALEPPAATTPVPAPTPAPAPAPGPTPLAPQPAEAAPAAPAGRRDELPVEAQLVRMGLLTLEQLAEANRTRLESGGTVADIAVANGWVTAEQVALLSGTAPAPVAPAPAPAPVPAPAPEVVPEPAPEPVLEPAPTLRVAEADAPAPAPAPAPLAPAPVVEVAPPAEPVETVPQSGVYRVALHLHGGERIDVSTADDEATAQQRAREIVFDLTRPRADEWPFYGGRFVRPDAILSVDILTDG